MQDYLYDPPVGVDGPAAWALPGGSGTGMKFIDIEFSAERFAFSVDEQALAAAEARDGKLILLTNVEDFEGEDIVERYKALADIERGFRVLKRDLEIAPVYHYKPERIRAHALVCFLALVLHRVARMKLRAAGSKTMGLVNRGLSPNFRNRFRWSEAMGLK